MMRETEFIKSAKEHFHFLCNEFNCSVRVKDAFTVEFENSVVVIRVEGINWGLNTRVALSAPGVKFQNYDFHDVLIGVTGFCARPKAAFDQLAQLPIYAALLRTYASSVLKGDLSSFTKAADLVEQRRNIRF